MSRSAIHARLVAVALVVWSAVWSPGCVEDVLLARECTGPTCVDLDAGACAGDAGACACALASARPLAHWPLDERAGRTASDARGHAGVLTHAPSQMPWVSGQVGGALAFDGVDDVVEVGPVAGSLRAVSLWVRANSAQATSMTTPLRAPTAHGPLDEWNRPELAYADDDMAATAASLIGTKQQHWGGFGLARVLPAQADIRGITVTVDTGNLGLLGGLSVELSWDGGASHTESRYGWGQLIVGSDLRQAGGADRLWGRAWSASEFADASFRVRASFGGIANAMALDYVGVEVEYAPVTLPRTLLNLRDGVYLEFAGQTIRGVGWSASVFVNGVANGALRAGWNHVAAVGPALTPSDVRLGGALLDTLSFPLDGALDDVLLLGEPLTQAQIDALARGCGVP